MTDLVINGTNLGRRVPAGRLNGIHAEVGTVLGPKEVTREYVVVTTQDDQGVTVGYATPEDMAAVVQRFPALPGWPEYVQPPRSVTEVVLQRGDATT